jgi:hypothetical protein
MPPSQIEFLNALFGSLARKLPPMPFHEGAGTARYLNNLAYEMPAGAERERILWLSKVIWERVFQFADFRTSGKEEAVLLLEQIANTHLVSYDVTKLIAGVRATPAPKPFRLKPMLVAPHMAITLGTGSKRLSDDLTERIYAGYWTLKLDKISNARRLVANALNTCGIPRQDRNGDKAWTAYSVSERLKQYEATIPKPRTLGSNSTSVKGRNPRDSHRLMLVEKWRHLCPIREVPVPLPRA